MPDDLYKQWVLEELDIIGEKRHGLYKPEEVIGQRNFIVNAELDYNVDGTFNFSNSWQNTQNSGKFVPVRDEEVRIMIRGCKQYELSNHLGNVLVTVSDRKSSRAISTTATLAEYYVPYVLTISDYYAFGSCIKERTVSFSATYRYGFNNQEQDVEMGEYYAFEYRIHDARLGRFLSVDPWEYKYSYQSSYVFAFNNPISEIDWKGLGEKPKPRVGDRKITDDGIFVFAGKKNGWVELNAELASAMETVINQKRSEIKGEFGSRKERKIERTLGKEWSALLAEGKELVQERRKKRREEVLKLISNLKPPVEPSYEIQDLISELSRKMASENLNNWLKNYEMPPWLSVAFGEMKKNPKRIKGPESDPNIKKYFSSDPNQPTLNDDYAWCAAFVTYCLANSGYATPTNNPYYTYNWYNGKGQPYRWENGVQLPNKTPVYGGIVFFDWGHVGIIVGKSGDRIYCLGGNQGPSEINVTSVHISNISAVMLPKDYTPPPLFYTESYLKQSYSGKIGPRGTTR